MSVYISCTRQDVNYVPEGKLSEKLSLGCSQQKLISSKYTFKVLSFRCMGALPCFANFIAGTTCVSTFGPLETGKRNFSRKE